MSVIIDVGHQGKGFDPGAIGNGIVEADMVLDISLYQLERFKELGVPVKITRTKTMALDNDKRAALIKNSGMKHCLCNHINAGGGDGAEMIYSIYGSPKLPQMLLDSLNEVGQNKRKIFTKTLPNNPKQDYYNVHRNTGSVETVIIEYGFLDSKKDDVLQLKRDWKLFAEAIVKGYCAYAGYKYKPKGGTTVSKNLYTDVASNHYAYDVIKKAKDYGLMQGFEDGSFKPNQPMTRAQLSTVAVRLYEKLKG